MQTLDELLTEYRRISEDTHVLEGILLSLSSSLSSSKINENICIKEDLNIFPSYSTCGRGNGICNVLGDLNLKIIRGKKNINTEFVSTDNTKSIFVLCGEIIIKIIKDDKEFTTVLEEGDCIKIDINSKYAFVFVKDSKILIYDKNKEG